MKGSLRLPITNRIVLILSDAECPYGHQFSPPPTDNPFSWEEFVITRVFRESRTRFLRRRLIHQTPIPDTDVKNF